jgi:hypothetical protein
MIHKMFPEKAPKPIKTSAERKRSLTQVPNGIRLGQRPPKITSNCYLPTTNIQIWGCWGWNFELEDEKFQQFF